MGTDSRLIHKLNQKLDRDRKSFRWFQQTYCDSMRYMTMVVQRNGYSPLDERFKAAISAYLES